MTDPYAQLLIWLGPALTEGKIDAQWAVDRLTYWRGSLPLRMEGEDLVLHGGPSRPQMPPDGVAGLNFDWGSHDPFSTHLNSIICGVFLSENNDIGILPYQVVSPYHRDVDVSSIVNVPMTKDEYLACLEIMS